MKPCFIFLSLILLTISIQVASAQKKVKWQAPQTADAAKNPLSGDANAALEGKKIFTSMCVVCHGETGKGNGMASVSLEPRPANFLSIEVRNESDGAIFWKMTEGRPPMASYKSLLSEQQRWQLVTYIRNLESKSK